MKPALAALSVLAGVFALATVVLGFIGLLGGAGISPLTLVFLLISLALLSVVLVIRRRADPGR